MICRQVQDQLPLWVEADLPAAVLAAVADHLQQCAACQTRAEALRASQAWLKDPEPPPFDLADRARLRREVMARIRAEAPRKTAFLRPRPLLAAAAVLLALLGTGLVHFLPQAPAPARPALAQASPRQVPIPEPPILPAAVPARPIPRPHLAHRPSPSARSIEAEPAVTRIELQTDNPQVRIIWLAQAQSEPLDSPANPL